jgi:hypothetical protein
MRESIINNLDNPKQLERLYREDKAAFKRDFNIIFTDFEAHPTAQIWYERLNFEQESISWGTKNELIVVIFLAFLAGLVAKLPQFLAIDSDYFYPRNIGFVVFPLLIAYFAWKKKSPTKNWVIAFCAVFLSLCYINFLPDNLKSDTLILACIHLPLFLWAIVGFIFVSDNPRSAQKRLDFLRYNGDLVVMTTIILIAGALMTVITMVLFKLIELRIEEFYAQYVIIWGLAAAPIIGTYLVQINPQLVNKISPVIAQLFTPLVFIMLAIYLLAVIYTGKDPYTNRDFLLIFNVLLIGVMALILFSIAETSKNTVSNIGTFLLLGLSVLTIIINGIALSAIIFRISEWGISPNRLAILGGNILILTNLLIVTYRLWKTTRNHRNIEKIETSIAAFLPVYIVWTIVVTFVFPIIFNFK